MKKVYLLLLFVFGFSAFAQQKGISYQAVIINPNAVAAPGYNGTSIPLANKAICLSFKIVNSTNQVEYQESQAITTDGYGMVNVVIGTGTSGAGLVSTLEAVAWNQGNKKLVVGVNTDGVCSNYSEISNQVLNYTPYSFYAQNADIKDGYVTTAKLADGAVTDPKVAMGINPAKVGLGNVNNTSDANKPVSTATQTALNLKANTTDVTTSLSLKEDISNKSNASLGTSTTLYPTQNAVKTYVDSQISSATIVDADATTKGKIKLAGDLAGTADLPTVPGLALKANTTDVTTSLSSKEDISNKSNASLGTSTTLYPTQNAVKTYVDSQISSATIVDADATTKGKIKLAGDLAGTADTPTVPGLALKAPLVSPSFTGTVTAPTYASTPISLTYSGSTIDWNPVQGLNAAITLTQNSALSFTANPPVGSYGTIVLTQDGTGNRTITLPSIAGVTNQILGSTSTTSVTLSTAANAKDILNFYYDGTNCYWNIGQGYGTAAAATSSTANLATGVTGTLAVANGGTGSTIQNFVDINTNQNIAGNKTFTSNATFNTQTIGKGNASGDSNLAVGAGAMFGASTGHRNTAIGNSAMQNYVGTSFDNNTSVGYNNLVALTTGPGNTSVGAESMMALTTGESNTSIGNQSLMNTTGSNNVGVGKKSGITNSVGNNNTLIGTESNVGSNNLTNATALGFEALVTANNSIQLGNTAVTNVKTNGTLTAGAVTYPNTNGTAGQVLTANNNGSATWTTVGGTLPTTVNTSANYNIVMATPSNTALVTGTGNGGNAATLNPYTGQMSISGLTVQGYGITSPIYASTPQALTAGATINWNPINGLNASVTLDQNSTLSFTTTPTAGSYGTLVVTQDATGGRTITLPSTANKVLGSTSSTTVALSTSAGAKDIVNFYFDGTNCYWNVGQGYGSASTFTATNIAGGASGSIPYQTGSGATSLLAKGTDGQILTLASGIPSWAAAPVTGVTSASSPLSISSNALSLGTVPVANGGTGLSTTPSNGQIDIGNGTGFSRTTLTAGTGISITNGSGAITIASSGTAGVPYSGANQAVDLGAYDLTVNGLTIGKGKKDAGTAYQYNSAFGVSALGSFSGGTKNTALGYNALSSVTSTDQNIAIGAYAMGSTTDYFQQSVAVGNQSLQFNKGSFNTALGSGALSGTSLTSAATYLVGVGALALMNNTSGQNNTAVGSYALSTNTTGNNNTALGQGADVLSAALDNATAIGYNAKVSSSNSIQLGNTSITNVKTSGTITAGDITYPKTHGTANQVLSTTGSGTLTWATPTVARPTTDQFTATAAQTSFTLTQTPLNAKVWMFINGIRTNNLAYTISGTTLTYTASNNNNYVLVAGDRIQFDYAY